MRLDPGLSDPKFMFFPTIFREFDSEQPWMVIFLVFLITGTGDKYLWRTRMLSTVTEDVKINKTWAHPPCNHFEFFLLTF